MCSVLRTLYLAALAARLLAGCTPQTPSTIYTPTEITLTPTPIITATLTPTATQTSAPTVTSTATPTPPPPSACSPLEGISIAELSDPDLLKNPFLAPRPGFDDGHHGADFAYWSRGERATMLGLPVYSVLGGTVAGVVQNHPPYGYAVIIETPLDALPAGWQSVLPVPVPTAVPADNLFCPAAPAASIPSSESRSLYLLYAHLDQPPLIAPEDTVTCGQQLGEVGTTGRSVNYHLHLETRVGPAGARFETLAHYDNAATNDEMGAYCAWRVSGLYQMLDPMTLLSLQP